MNDHDTTVLSSRLHHLADDMTPAVDVVAQVRAARARHRSRRRARLTVLAVATVTATMVVGVPIAIGTLTSSAPSEVAGPADLSTSAVPTTNDADMKRAVAEARVAAQAAQAQAALEQQAAAEAALARQAAEAAAEVPGLPVPAGWERRTFQGVTFAVPPGSRTADTIDESAEPSFMEGPSLTWNGPSLGDGEYSLVTVRLLEPFEGGLPPMDGDYFLPVVPGGTDTHAFVLTLGPDNDPIPGRTTVERTSFGVQILAGDRRVVIGGQFPAGAAGEQMARDVIASIAVT
ncbi:hypothetical protein [Blastococcus haudaquaticus]|uniref:Uncharacterized protein n=1 Tax=Blastococcus haudaquaticus TaxID=1938745 RepID=A0A286GZL5_9ACTN|nr:hypothetical protein [Blastococcus haudaquaticus]SOE00504.1 hypothetical protein SAMN06272739_2635 [Blastococcus haudaquaticus]